MPSVGEFAGLEARTMTETVRRFPPPKFAGEKLFEGPQPSITSKVYWDIVEGTRKLGKFSTVGAEAHVRALEPRKRVHTELLYVREKKVIDEATKNFIERVGEFDEPYGQQLLNDELEALNRVIENTKEWARWQAIVRGQLDVRQSDPPVYVKIDYGYKSSHKPTLTGTNKWSDTSNSKPLSNLLTWKRLISRDSWLTPARAYCSSQVMQYLVENSNIQTLIQYTVGNQLAQNGYLTVLAGLDITVYDVSYVDDDGNVQQFVPDDKFVVVAREAIGKEITGPQDVPTDNGVKTMIGKISYSWVTKDPVDTWILVGDSFIPAIQQPDGIVSATIAQQLLAVPCPPTTRGAGFANNNMSYCTSADLDQYLGKIPVASGLNKDTFIDRAADEIHLRAAGIYKVPIEIKSSVDSVTSGVTTNILKLWNAKLAAGYLILAASITQENTEVHDYGKMLVDTTIEELERMKKQELVLVGATADTTPTDDLARPTKSLISSPDGTETALDDDSFFNRPYKQIGDKDYEVEGGPDL